jgi:hypothetical protein
MHPVGVTWWKLPALFGAIQILILIFGLYLPKLVKSFRSPKSEI